MADIDPSHILFPSDAPSAPDPAMNPLAFAKDDAAARLMRRVEPAEQAGQPDAKPADAKPDTDIAKTLFGDTTKPDYEGAVRGELETYRLSAHADGDTERAEALGHATQALAADFAANDTEPTDLKEAFEIVRHSAGMVPPTLEEREASFTAGMSEVQSAGISDADLSAARSFIRDLETVSPGVVASLNAHGAGNDIRLIRKTVAEARRRGY
ncbi:hypothetical protein [Brucella sp. 191011898]|uniref:hypothetical protein n=1 Tax=Brucella sp. 191011898 TaxID=2730447 RepID=UPI0015DD923A|nr:hypothetical protein [Brucella sp. 191011898]CAB4325014.1 hypothetical protein BCH_00233 [Brucella sp. 191011898]